MISGCQRLWNIGLWLLVFNFCLWFVNNIMHQQIYYNKFGDWHQMGSLCFWGKSHFHPHICRLTETARLLKNVRNVFTFTRRSATRVNMEVELARKYVITVFSKWMLTLSVVNISKGKEWLCVLYSLKKLNVSFLVLPCVAIAFKQTGDLC